MKKVGNVVGAAVGGVSQAVTSVATTAETGQSEKIPIMTGRSNFFFSPSLIVKQATTTKSSDQTKDKPQGLGSKYDVR